MEGTRKFDLVPKCKILRYFQNKELIDFLALWLQNIKNMKNLEN